ncbi:hypothetical protein VP01_1359g3 [Puccinia sorghi]|uniref:Uncharacterized protein n=1 Tax=Puccinia sorghi TaxID=27349 RepID=A0A0L6VLZ1_9BASI|nr:hypothetical protein VP01_1359g3 [Puccinia sorghi]
MAHKGHTGCYKYFMKKDGCVFSAKRPTDRCPAVVKHDQTNPAQAFVLNPAAANVKRSEDGLARRYDTTQPSFAVAGGNGICGFYNSTAEHGVCLWSGPEQTNPTRKTAGWLNEYALLPLNIDSVGRKANLSSPFTYGSPNPVNCRKGIYVQRKGQPETVKYVPLLDGCSFNTISYEPGCFDIALTIKLFDDFNPSEQEKKDGLLYGGLTWDYDNVDGNHPQNAPR